MKVIDLLRLERESLKVMSDCGLKVEDYGYIAMYDEWNKGYTFTNFGDHLTVSFVSKTTSPEQMYDSIQHETKHITDHICEYYGIEPTGEESAYLQGEIAKQMFPAAALVVCPKCHDE